MRTVIDWLSLVWRIVADDLASSHLGSAWRWLARKLNDSR